MNQTHECEKCGNSLLEGDLKCKICNHFSGRECPVCGSHVASGLQICNTCGHDLGPEFPFSSGTTRPLPPNEQGGEDVETSPPPLPQESLPEEPPSAPEPPEESPQLDHPYAGLAETESAGSDRASEMETPPATPDGNEPPPSIAESENLQEDRPVPGNRPLPGNRPVPGKRPVPVRGGAPRKINFDHYQKIMEKCEELIAARCNLYGVLGRPEAGKTCFIYALGKLIKGAVKGPSVMGNYTLDPNWEDLIRYQERIFEEGVVKGTPKGLHFYKAQAIGKMARANHFALIDIRGEQFEQIDDWNREITDFFITYLTHCKGLFLFLDLDQDAVAGSAAEVYDRRAREKGSALTDEEKERYREAYQFKRNQMSHMVSFLSVAATIPKMLTVKNFFEQRSAMSTAHRDTIYGSRTLDIPVALCISKADLIKDYRFEGSPAVVPGSDDLLGDPWQAVSHFWEKDLQSMKKIAPKLKLEWVSSTGDNFDASRGIGRPRGLDSVFRFVVENPPPNWALSSESYARWRRFFFL